MYNYNRVRSPALPDDITSMPQRASFHLYFQVHLAKGPGVPRNHKLQKAYNYQYPHFKF